MLRKNSLNLIAYISIFIGQAFVYLPVLTSKFLLPDDYDYFYAGITHSNIFTIQAIAQNRLFNILVAPSFGWVGKVDDMWIFRLIGLLGIFAVALCIFHAYRKYGENIFLAACFILMITIMPAFQEYATWAVLYIASWGAVISYGAFLCMEKAALGMKLAKWLWAFSSIFLLVIAYNIHPTSAMFVAVFITIFFLYSSAEKRLERTFFFLILSGIGAIANYVIFKAYLLLFNTSALERAALITNPLEKLLWFITRPLFKAINLISIPADLWIALGVTLIIFSGLSIYLWQKGQQKDFGVSLIFLFLLILLSYSSNLVIDENLANYRTLLALTGVIAVITFKAIEGYISLVKNSRTRIKVSYLVIGILTIFCVIFARFFSYTDLLTKPMESILVGLRSSLQQFDRTKYQKVVITFRNNSEYEQIQTQHYPTLINTILYEKDMSAEQIPVTFKPANYISERTDYIIPLDELTPNIEG